MILWDTEVEMLTGLAFSPDGQRLTVAGSSGVGSFRVPDGQRLGWVPTGYPTRVRVAADRAVLIHPDRFTFVVPDSGLEVDSGPVGHSLLATAANGRAVATNSVVSRTTRPRPKKGSEQEPHPPRIVQQQGLTVFDRSADGWVPQWVAAGFGTSGNRAALSPDGRCVVVATAGSDRCHVWTTGAVSPWRLKTDVLVGVGFAGHRMLAYSRAGLQIWDTNERGRKPLYIYGGPHERLDDLAVHPDGRRAFLTNFARTVLVVDLHTGTVETTMDWGVPLLSKVAVSADGTLAAAANHGGQVVLWDLDP